jgi:hypothetical protein
MKNGARARNVDQKNSIQNLKKEIGMKTKFKSRCIFRKETMRTVEMKINNSDTKRYPENER